MKRYNKPSTNVVLMHSEPVMAPISGGGKSSFSAELKTEDAPTGVVLGKENTLSPTNLWEGEEEE